MIQFSDLSTTAEEELVVCVLVFFSEGADCLHFCDTRNAFFLPIRNYNVFQHEYDLLATLISNWYMFNSKNSVRNV